MPGVDDDPLRAALKSLSHPDLLIDYRVIAAGDEQALLDAESASISSRSPETRRASGAARIVARHLLAELGVAPTAIPKGSTGAPVWPAGIIGSFAHDETIAIAAVGRKGDAASIGIDIEPAKLLPADMLDLVTTASERTTLADDPFRGRLLFTAKEAVYKAVHPLDGLFLEFHDIAVDLAGCRAVTRNGRLVTLRTCVSTRLVVLALA